MSSKNIKLKSALFGELIFSTNEGLNKSIYLEIHNEKILLNLNIGENLVTKYNAEIVNNILQDFKSLYDKSIETIYNKQMNECIIKFLENIFETLSKNSLIKIFETDVFDCEKLDNYLCKLKLIGFWIGKDKSKKIVIGLDYSFEKDKLDEIVAIIFDLNKKLKIIKIE